MTPEVILTIKYISCIVLGYLLGSIPCGVIVTKRMANLNVLELGSRSTGTTNVLRTAGRKAAIIAFAGDVLKGALAVTFARIIMGHSYVAVGIFGFGPPFGLVLAALAAMVGGVSSKWWLSRGGSRRKTPSNE